MPPEGSGEKADPLSLAMQVHIEEETLATHRGRILMATKLERMAKLGI